MASLKPAFDPAGTVTAANASKINDGAAADHEDYDVHEPPELQRLSEWLRTARPADGGP